MTEARVTSCAASTRSYAVISGVGSPTVSSVPVLSSDPAIRSEIWRSASSDGKRSVGGVDQWDAVSVGDRHPEASAASRTAPHPRTRSALSRTSTPTEPGRVPEPAGA